VIEAGRSISLSPVSNFARGGGEAINIGSELDPSYTELARRAFEALPGLKLGGMDMAISEPDKPASDTNCSVIEINSSPLIDAFYFPWVGEPQDTAASIVRMLRREAAKAGAAASDDLDMHARLLADAATARGIAIETAELPGRTGGKGEIHLRLTVGESVFQYRQGAMRWWSPSDPAGPGTHINGTATRITSDEFLTLRSLKAAGLPALHSRLFLPDKAHLAIDYACSMEAARIVGGAGSANREAEILRAPREMISAVNALAKAQERILVEEVFAGEDIAVFVVDGRAVAATRAGRKLIVGNGRETALALCRAAQEVSLAEALECLCEQGLDFGSVLEAGRAIAVSRARSLADGELLDGESLHADYYRLAERAAGAIDELRLCAVRMNVLDIEAPLADRNAVLLRVSSSPALAPFCGGRPGRQSKVCNAILDLLDRLDDDGR
jgi:D-alanine-D-alanine ligase-like ATP-grasp enzyme